VATLAHGGQTLATYEIVITDATGRRVCTARLTCLIREQVPGREANGVYPLRAQGAINSLTRPALAEGSLCATRRRVANV
jgi:hypothetical protein